MSAAWATAGAGFLLAVLWFDLMFDVQARARPEANLPEEVLSSIAGYYARVTTAARPMNRLVAVTMVVTIAAVIVELATGDAETWAAWLSLVLVVVAAALAGTRTVPNAVRLGQRQDDVGVQSRLARAILRDHCVCFTLMLGFMALQLAAATT